MNKNKELDFTWYDIRVGELDKLFSSSKSKTQQELISEAKSHTEKSLELLVLIQKMTVVILAAKDIETKKQLKEFGEQFRLLNLESERLKSTAINGRIPPHLLGKHSRDFAMFEKKLAIRQKVHDLTFKIYPLAVDEFEKILFDLIFKPDNTSFHYESILDIINYVIGKIIPGLDDLKAAKKIIPYFRKKDFAQKGDKLMLYLEQYIDVLDKWTSFGNAYVQILGS